MKTKLGHSSVNNLRKEYHNFLWAVWKSLPQMEGIQNPVTYAPVDANHKDVVIVIGKMVYEFLFGGFSAELKSKLKIPIVASEPTKHSFISPSGNCLVISFFLDVYFILF
jgi:hypothetical protein